jgi:hypothetical protein
MEEVLRAAFGVWFEMMDTHSGLLGGPFTRYRSILALLFCCYVVAFIDRGLLRIGVARADLYPHFSLTGVAGAVPAKSWETRRQLCESSG